MKLIIQRVSSCTVVKKDTNQLVGEIGKGLLILLGFKKGDSYKEVDYLADKIVKLRVMADRSGKMNLSVVDTKSEILVVSQFTLYANTSAGNRPSFIEAEDPSKAKILYEYFIEKLREKDISISTGSFGDYMQISCILDGPVTIVFDKTYENKS